MSFQKFFDILPELYVKMNKGTIKNGIKRGQVFLKRNNIPCNPVGSSNSKTGVASAYRPVGAGDGGTCHKSCPLLNNGCYAQGGNVNIHQIRAQSDLVASLAASALAIMQALREDTKARNHVSGDFMKNNEIDVEYISALICVVNEIKRLACISDNETVMWTYTHIPREEFELWRLLLASAGIVVLYSDRYEAGGAVVHSFDRISQLRQEHPTVKFAKCLAQLKDNITCKKCGLCWESRSLKHKNGTGICIVFDPHGTWKKRIHERLFAI